MLNFLIFIVVLSILIVVHEFGHFLAARRSGVKVERFAIGFGPPLLKIKGKETQFLICLFPLGGYVKLAGDSRTEHKGLNYEFLSKPIGVRARVIFFGPLFNYILAVIIFWIAFMVGFPYSDPDTFVGKVVDDYPAAEAGIKEGDKIIKIDNKNADNWMEIVSLVSSSEGEITLTLLREGKTIKLKAIPKEMEGKDKFGKEIKRRVIGIEPVVKIMRANPFVAFYKGIQMTIVRTFLLIQGLILIISGKIPAKDAAVGIIGIYHLTSEAAKVGLIAVLDLMGVLSLTLAIINLIPFPVLDGGHIFFLCLEKMRKKPLSEKVEEVVIRVGMVALLLLIGIVLYNDILRFVIGK